MVSIRQGSRRTPGGIGYIIRGAALAVTALLLSGCTEPPKTETFWSPDGETIAYVAGDAPLGGDSLFLYTVEAKTSAKLATGAQAVVSPCWSPDGKAIAFYSISTDVDPDSMSASVSAVDLGTGQVEVLQAQRWPKSVARPSPAGPWPEEGLRCMALWYGQPASWSPDGSRLACVGPDPTGTAISLLSYPSGTTAPIVQTGGTIGWLAWSPDGRKIAYVWFPAPEGERYWEASLWVYDLATATTTRIADLGEGSPVEGTMIVWSADSARIGFIGRVPGHGGDCARVVDATPGAAVTTLLADVAEVEDPTKVPDRVAAVAWAPELSGVAFIESKWDGTRREGPVLVYRGLQSPGRRELGPVPSGASTPQFSADGRWVAAAVRRPGGPSQMLVFPMP